MLPLVLMVPLALVSLDLVVPWRSASGVGLLPALTPSGWASEEARSRRLSAEKDLEKQLEEYEKEFGLEDPYGDISASVSDDLSVLFAFLVVVALVYIAGIVGQCVFACQYKAKVTEKRPPLQGGAAQLSSAGDFATGTFNCFDDMPTCLHACCCMPCRAGDTYQAAGIEQYWTVIGLLLLLAIIGELIGKFIGELIASLTKDTGNLGNLGNLVAGLLVGGVFHRYRRRLRASLGGSEEGGPNLVVDFLLFGFCTNCVVAQEARAIDAATGVKVECCCQLTDAAGQPLDGQPLIGQPVNVA